MITVADMFEKPKQELFSDAPDTPVYTSCRQREKEIKEAIRFTTRAWNRHIQAVRKNKDALPEWKRQWIKSCLRNLGGYIEELINELDRKKIEEYCKARDANGKLYIAFMADMVLIMINSYHGAVENDIHWVSDLTLADSIDISTGDFDFNKLTNYMPARIEEIEILMSELNEIDYVKKRSDSILEAIDCFKTERFKASNLLLITTIEGLVRSLGIYLTQKQALSIDPTNKYKYASLDSFLKKIPWKRDLQLNSIQYGLLTGSYSLAKTLRRKTNSISLTERLGFLCRRFKENRNTILHGEETDYANPLNNFLNFSALKEVLIAVKEYHTLYDGHL